VKAGVYSTPAVQQDVAPTLAAALGVKMPPAASGRVLPVLQKGFARPRVIMLIVLDGMRRDYLLRAFCSSGESGAALLPVNCLSTRGSI